MKNEEFILLKVFLVGILCSIFTLACPLSFISAMPITAQYNVEIELILFHFSPREEACIHRNGLSQLLGHL